VRLARRSLTFPYAKASPVPRANDLVREARVDGELAREGFTYVLESGKQGTVHVEQVLEYNEDASHAWETLVYNLTVEAQKRVAASPLSKREIIRRLGTSATQFYRLLDQTNYRKSLSQLLALLHVVDCDVTFTVKRRKSA
jgi:hypothetical protein